MTRRSKLLLTVALTATVLFSIAATATANRLSVSEPRFRIEFPNGLEITSTERGYATDCRITLEGSLHSPVITKTAGSLIGYITRTVLTRPCSGGELTILTETLPWHVQYGNFSGTLPAIRSYNVSIIGMKMRVDPNGLFNECLFTTEESHRARGEFTRPGSELVVSFNTVATDNIPCSSWSVQWRGEGFVTKLDATSTFTLTLI